MTTNHFVTGPGSEQLSVFYQGVGGLTSVESVPSASASFADKTQTVAVCDVDGDGRNEILVGYQMSDLTVYKVGANRIPFLWRTIAGVRSFSLLCADVDGDGLSDVIATGTPGVTMQVLLQRGGALVEQGNYPSTGVFMGVHDVGDINGDGKADIVFFGAMAPQWKNNLLAYVQTTPGQFAASPVVLDFPRDPFDDIRANGLALSPLAPGTRNAVASLGGNAPSAKMIVARYGTGAQPPSFVELPTIDVPQYIRVTDINGDGRPDIAVYHNGFGVAGVYYQNVDGTFTVEQQLETFIADQAIGLPAIAFGDFDSNGKVDIAVASQSALFVFFQD